MPVCQSDYVLCSQGDLRDLDADRSRQSRRGANVSYSSQHTYSAEARELSSALDTYKLRHRRCYLTFEEIVGVLRDLGYRKTS
ncbi:MAG: hypothetical protein Q4G68_06065 [Planctomycetia bacterium]|nr:hypothetical protein [Planctomycetia bacterium]